MSYTELFAKDIEKAFSYDCSLDFDRPVGNKERDINVIDQQVLFSLLKNPEIVALAFQDPDILINVSNTLRNMNAAAEMDASMMIDKKEEETVSDLNNEKTEEAISDNTTGSDGATANHNNEGASTEDTSPATPEKTEGSVDSQKDIILKQIKSEDIFTVAELQEELNGILKDDINDYRLTEVQVRWVRNCQKILRTTFKTLNAMELYCANFHKAVKNDLSNRENTKNLRPMRKMDINVLRVMYESSRPEEIIADLKYNIFYECLPLIKAPYRVLNTFVRYCENL